MEIKKKDIIGMIAMMKCNYPYAYKDQPKDETNMLINTWLAIFKKYPKEVVQSAFYKALETCKMPPTIADITEIINSYEEAVEESENDIWSDLERATRKCRGYTYHGMQPHYYCGEWINPMEKIGEVFNSLHPIAKEFCGSVESFAALIKLDTLDFEKARFLKMLPTLKKRVKVRSEVNPSILALVSENKAILLSGSQLKIEEKKE